MSDGDSSVFGVDDGNESPPSPEPVKKKLVKKAAVPKKPAVPKNTAAPKKTAPAAAKSKATSKKRAISSDMDASDGGEMADTPPSAKKLKKAPASRKPAASKKTQAGKPLQPRENELELDSDEGDPVNSAPAEEGKKSGDAYQKLTQLEHILKRPDTYVGSVERSERQMWVFDSDTGSMVWKTVTMVPGLYKIFDEILVNAADNKIRDPRMDALKVTVDRANNTISVWNNGRGIPIQMHSKEGVWVPELIFGHLLTSSNYDDDEKKVTGGRNGYGAKLCNIFSTEFTVETGDKASKQKYTQTWTNNMSKMGKAKITSNSRGEQFTKVTFKPDLSKFHMEEMDNDFEALVKRRVYDMAASVRGVKVYLNGELIKLNFKKYCEMYVNALHEENGGDEKPVITSEVINDRWEVGFAASSGSFQQVSFVNSIATTSGGTHVNAIADQLCQQLTVYIKKQNKSGAAVKNAQIRNHFFLFVNCLIENPAFTSQTKEQLTTKMSAFGSKCSLSDGFVKNVVKNTPVIGNIIDFANMKADRQLKKTDGSRRARINNPKLIDANRAGTKDGHECILILTEGDSAKTLAVAGISAINGRDRFGVFPLRGKLLNVRDASHDQIMKNQEIQNIKQILGLQHKKVYESRKDLRYGHLMIMTDQDYDGSHIKGLLINFFETQFPSLLKLPNFLIEFITPIVKVFKGGIKKPTKEISFFTMPEYEYWKENNKEKGWEHKYYKGLGTSGERDAKQYFADLERHIKEFHVMEEEGRQLIELAFSKKKADERKEWLRLYKPGTYLDHSIDKISYPDFVNKELILFSMADNVRSIPSVVDGLKPGQRKILFACFKRNLKKQLKVAELAGFVSESTAYQHGEASLQATITGMAQTYVGSNNLNLLEPEGSFGTRLDGGKDAASPRYIYTFLSPFARKLFPAMDEPLLTYNMDDDKRIEPIWYAPIVPLVLINGADGIGTGWSTNIPNFNPEDVVDNIRRLMNNEDLKPMTPWYRDWTGTVEKTAEDKYKFTGIVNQIDNLTVEIRELPVKMWTQEFKERLEDIIKAEKTPSFIKDYVDYNSPRRVHFIITMESEKHMQAALEEGLANKFKLSKTVATSNLVAFDAEGRITKYHSVNDILKEFYYIRLKLYQERKDWMLQDMNRQLMKFSNQARFVKMIINKELVVSGKKRADIIEDLMKKKFDKISKKDAEKAGETVETVDGDDDATGGDGYNYLLGMAIWSLTHEKIEKLLKEVADKELEIDELIKKSPKDLWNAELDAFIEEWHRELEDDKNEQGTTVKKKKGGKYNAKITKGKKKGGNDDESDFEASKSKRKPAASKVKVEAKKQTLLGFKPADPPLEKAAPEKNPIGRAAKKEAVVEELSDSDFDMIEGKPKAVQKPKPLALGASIDIDSSSPVPKPPGPGADGANNSDSEASIMDEKPPPKSKAALVKKTTEVLSDSNDSDFGDIKPKRMAAAKPGPKGRAPAKEIQKAKVKKAISDLDDSDFEDLKPKKTAVAKPGLKGRAPAKEIQKAKAPAIGASLLSLDESDSPPLRAAASKPKRAAAKKPSILEVRDSDDSDGGAGLGDVSVLVKGISSQGSDTGRPLFRDSAKKPTGAALKGAAAKKVAPKGVSKIPINLAKGDKFLAFSDSDDDVLAKPPKKAIAKKPATAQPPLKKAVETKKVAAKPPAKGRPKKLTILSDEDDDDIDADKMASELLDSDDGIEAKVSAPPEPRRRAARTTKVTNYKFANSTDDDDDESASDDYGGDSE